jgi:uncharacterized Fe-S cluster-containing radical SAM superfamily protein
VTKLRDAARDQPCVRCGRNDGTTVLAHYFGPRRHQYGGGMSHKGHDAIGAHLCAACHSYMDTWGRSRDTRWEHSEEFLHLCALTIIRNFEQGVIK